jgi:hypothetical protein
MCISSSEYQLAQEALERTIEEDDSDYLYDSEIDKNLD